MSQRPLSTGDNESRTDSNRKPNPRAKKPRRPTHEMYSLRSTLNSPRCGSAGGGVRRPRTFFSGHLAPQPYVGKSLFVARHDHLGSLGDGAAVLTAPTAHAARSHLRIDDFACSALPD